MAKKVFVVLARQNYEGPFKGLSVHVAKRDAIREGEKVKMMWDEVKVMADFDYLVGQYFK